METYTDLFPYQKDGVEKLKHLKIGALYMGTGTGKTRTALELIKLRLDKNKIDRVLWLCPYTLQRPLLDNIKGCSDLWQSGLLTIKGIESTSTSVRICEELMDLVCNYRVFLVVDESTLVKNHNALRSMHITQIANRCTYKLILSGTPATKTPADLFAQWYLLDWRILGYKSYYSFEANHLEYDEYGRLRRCLNIDYLTEKIAPYTYQVDKSECLNLPPKKYITKSFKMTDEQNENYDYVIDRLLLTVDEMQPSTIYRFFGALQAVTCGYALRINNKLEIEKFKLFLNPMDNPRIAALQSILQINNEKCIIFCKYLYEVEMVMTILNKETPGNAVAYTGNLSARLRNQSLNDFSANSQYLVATKECGSYGLNLQFCHRIIFLSNDWDFGTRIQAEDRIYRYGQTHNVEIIDICCYESIDEKIMNCLNKKEGMAQEFRTQLKHYQKKDLLMTYARGESYGKNIPKN